MNKNKSFLLNSKKQRKMKTYLYKNVTKRQKSEEKNAHLCRTWVAWGTLEPFKPLELKTFIRIFVCLR